MNEGFSVALRDKLGVRIESSHSTCDKAVLNLKKKTFLKCNDKIFRKHIQKEILFFTVFFYLPPSYFKLLLSNLFSVLF